MLSSIYERQLQAAARELQARRRRSCDSWDVRSRRPGAGECKAADALVALTTINLAQAWLVAYNHLRLNSSSPVREPSVSEIQAELKSLLDSREFRQSRGLSKLLRYICGKALVGDPEPITEYTIAMDVLGKPQGFKENKDASVRVEVHRLRRRLAEFYRNEGASHRLRIVIPTGHYTPEFVIQDDGVAVMEPEIESTEGTAAVEVPDLAPPLEPVWEPVPLVIQPRVAGRWRIGAKIAAGVLVCLALALVVRALLPSSDPLASLWRPVLASPGPTLLCIGDMSAGREPAPDEPNAAQITVRDFHHLRSQGVLITDAATMTRFAGLLQSRGKAYRVASQSETTFEDLQNGPAVLIGLANNDWTERLVGKLRFWLQHTPGGKLIIRDREHPDRMDWNLDYSEPVLEVTKDYALVMRVLDPKTEQTVISAAGISVFGTLAAGDFLTNDEEFRKIEAVAPRGWRKMNFELVLSTDVIRGKSGHANIVAWHFW